VVYPYHSIEFKLNSGYKHPSLLLIVGAGLFGATFAQRTTDAGYRCLFIDRRTHYSPLSHVNTHSHIPQEPSHTTP